MVSSPNDFFSTQTLWYPDECARIERGSRSTARAIDYINELELPIAKTQHRTAEL